MQADGPWSSLAPTARHAPILTAKVGPPVYPLPPILPQPGPAPGPFDAHGAAAGQSGVYSNRVFRAGSPGRSIRTEIV